MATPGSYVQPETSPLVGTIESGAAPDLYLANTAWLKLITSVCITLSLLPAVLVRSAET